MSEWRETIEESDLELGTCKHIALPHIDIVLFNLDGEYYAMKDCCTHADGELSQGEIDNDKIICPLHGASFEIKTGKVVDPPAEEDVLTFETKVENHKIFVNC